MDPSIQPQKFQDKLINDCEAEMMLYRDIDSMNRFIEETRQFTEEKVAELLTDDELKRYIKSLPGRPNSCRRAMIIKWLKENPAMCTLNPDLLWQRFTMYKNHFGEVAKLQQPLQTQPMKKVLNSHQEHLNICLKMGEDHRVSLIKESQYQETLARLKKQEANEQDTVNLIPLPIIKKEGQN